MLKTPRKHYIITTSYPDLRYNYNTIVNKVVLDVITNNVKKA